MTRLPWTQVSRVKLCSRPPSKPSRHATTRLAVVVAAVAGGGGPEWPSRGAAEQLAGASGGPAVGRVGPIDSHNKTSEGVE